MKFSKSKDKKDRKKHEKKKHIKHKNDPAKEMSPKKHKHEVTGDLSKLPAKLVQTREIPEEISKAVSVEPTTRK